MALNLENATIGYDSAGLQGLINEINIKCISDTVTALNQGIANIRTSVDTAWVGNSAERFKAKVEEDANNVSKIIQELGDAVVDALKGAGGGMIQVDENIKI